MLIMKKYKSSDLTHKRAEVFKEAEKGGVIIQKLNTNGDVEKEFILQTVDRYIDKLMESDLTTDDQYFIAVTAKR